MNIAELRIGNVLYFTNDIRIKPENRSRLVEITAEDILFLSKNPDIDYIRPVFLSARIIQKCGFDFLKDYAVWSNKQHCISMRGDDFIFMPFWTNDELCHIKITYLHQLQNITFAQEGKELKIKL